LIRIKILKERRGEAKRPDNQRSQSAAFAILSKRQNFAKQNAIAFASGSEG
jgi:hypothetical protein